MSRSPNIRTFPRWKIDCISAPDFHCRMKQTNEAIFRFSEGGKPAGGYKLAAVYRPAASRRARFIRVCQPGPLALNRATTS